MGNLKRTCGSLGSIRGWCPAEYLLWLPVLHNRERAAMRGQRRLVQLAVCLAALLLVSGASGYPYRHLLADGAADPADADPADQPLYSLVRSSRWFCAAASKNMLSGLHISSEAV